MAAQIDRQCLFAVLFDRHQLDCLDHRAQGLYRAAAIFYIRQAFPQALDLAPVIVRHVRVQQHRRFVIGTGQLAMQLCLARLKLGHLVFDLAARHAVEDRLHQPLDLALGLGKRGFVSGERTALRGGQLVLVLGVFLTEDLYERRVHQFILEPVQHGRFQYVPAQRGQIIAGPFVAGIRAADPHAVEVNDPAAAAAADHQPGKHVARDAPVDMALVRFAELAAAGSILPRLHPLPQILIDDPQLRHVLDDPLVLRVKP